MNQDELKVVNEKRGSSSITKLSKNKVVIEVDNDLDIVTFWETKYTFRQIVELVHSIPALAKQVSEYNFKDEL